MGSAVLGFLRFWYDFIVGDDWTLAAGAAAAVTVAAIAALCALTGKRWLRWPEMTTL